MSGRPGRQEAGFTLATPTALAEAEPAFANLSSSRTSSDPDELGIDASTPGRWSAAIRSNYGQLRQQPWLTSRVILDVPATTTVEVIITPREDGTYLRDLRLERQ